MLNFKYLITIINFPRLFLHLLFFFIYKNRCEDDVRVALNHRKIECNLSFGFCYLLVFDKTFRNLFYFRIGKAKYLMCYWLKPHPTFTLATNMIVGPGFLCMHPFATIVNAISIGSNFEVRNNVTIGYNENGGRPKIGSNVKVFVNSVIVGDITIGDNSIIGAGTILTKNVPSDCVVVGNPAHILYEKGKRVYKRL